MSKLRKSMTITSEDDAFYTRYAERKGIKGGFAGLVSVALHAYVARNKAKGLHPPWEPPPDEPTETESTRNAPPTGDKRP